MKAADQKPLRKLFAITICLGSPLLITACASIPQNNTSVKIDGSSTVYPITKKVVEEFKANSAEAENINVEFSGTKGGFAKFCQGQTDINNASRPILASEMELCGRNGVSYIELPIAFDALTVVVNPKNTWIDSISTAELKKIWEPAAEGKITRWNQIRPDFPKEEIKLFGAGKKSGTFDYFTEAIVGTEDASRTDYVASEDDDVTVQGVSQDPNAMGYFGLSYYEANKDKLKALAIDSGKGPIAPSSETVVKATYQPLTRPLFIYINLKSAQDKQLLKNFIAFYLDRAREIVPSIGYIPLSEESYHINEVTFNRGEAGTVFGGKSDFNTTLPEIQRKQAQLRVETASGR